ncbi:hypothetical protein HY338_03965 [Candidatus Gottesmanbacteria bacterium]|nr:hypothetical protein [Candidatus Gottesmanbacteria bacterium]
MNAHYATITNLYSSNMSHHERSRGNGSVSHTDQASQPDNPLYNQTLPAVREALKSGNISPAMQAEIDGLMPRALSGEFLNLAPPGAIEKVILFFQPPKAFPTGNIYPHLVDDDSVPFIKADKGFRKESKNFVRDFWVFLNRCNRYTISFDPKTIASSTEMAIAHTLNLVPMSERFTENFKQAAALMIEGYDGRMRRTGEPFTLHSLRTFISFFADRLPHSIDQTWILHTSLLASLLHDMREDFRDVSWKYLDGDRYLLTCKGKNGQPLEAFFRLASREKQLLDLQLEALKTPDTPQGIPDAYQTQIQFAHLQEISQQIADDPRFGPLAAFYTLLIKWKDRFDNICTYWERDKDGKIFVNRQNKLEKLNESYSYFRAVEADAKRYLFAWARQPGGNVTLRSKNETARLELEKYLDSIVRFSQRILFGGQINDMLEESVDSYQKEYMAVKDTHGTELREVLKDDFSMKYPFLIPTPQAQPKPVNILQFPLQHIIYSLGFNPLRVQDVFEFNRRAGF